jgi:hypothetical protein
MILFFTYRKNDSMKVDNKITIKSIFILTLISLITACGQKQESKPVVKAKVRFYQQIKTLRGAVSDAKGPVTEGVVKVRDSKGKVVASTQLENSRHYTVNIPAGTTLPIVLSIKLAKKAETLQAVIISTAIAKYDISTMTTKIAKRAKELGGYTHSNMIMAADSTIGVLESNKTSTGFRGDPTRQYGGWH